MGQNNKIILDNAGITMGGFFHFLYTSVICVYRPLLPVDRFPQSLVMSVL